MKLYSRYQNSAGERVRIALNLKGISYDYVPLNSLQPGAFRRINPQGLMPALEVAGGVIAQSAAILSYLEETCPDPPLLPHDAVLRGQARAFGAYIAGEMHAVTVNRVRRFLAEDFSADDAALQRWSTRWFSDGFAALEAALANRPAPCRFCFGDTPGWADLHLVPQLAAARRLGYDPSSHERLLAVEANCVGLDAFVRARPEAQPDYPGAVA
jgi:maleylacetoacetate isomerase